jgi:flagellar biosynthetic protein FlhB
VVAIGVDHLALRIRRIAAQHGIPIVERKPLARLLHRTVKTGDPIPPESYAAVAEVLAFVYRMNGQAA